MKFNMFEFDHERFIVTSIDWERCEVTCWEGWGWHDSSTFCQSSDGGVIKPIIGFNYSQGCGELISLLPNLVPEVGWTVIGKDNGRWICVPPWYVFPVKEDPPNRVKKAALIAACLLTIWGGIKLLPQTAGVVNQPQTTYQAK